ncbi:GDYXXLXY domain-containing protein [Dongshaea marina]|uniref:GDYXXLXY domain-containing protein n=1 Tax=Dongshaea marina TaxID=2047966 RepID=UPI000D3E3B86|nr:GDYXXLXY domain-containing protein [Dongshaea marina]
MKSKVTFAILLAITFQLLVLIGMVLQAALPLWTGSPIEVKTIPVDPRSLFRGNYARLGYEFSRIPRSAFSNPAALHKGALVYVLLSKGADGLYQFSTASVTQPSRGIFLRGRVEQARFFRNKQGYVRIRYGIEAYFAPKQKALALEKQLRSGGIALLMVAPSGKARIKAIQTP